MCGVAVIWDKHARLNDHPMRQMLKQLSKRGPDDEHFLQLPLTHGQLFMGHTLLRFYEHAPRQPVRNPAYPLYLVYNGQIYNTTKLSRRFSLSHVPSDTELLWYYLYAQTNGESVPALEGMYAWVAYDHLNNRLLLGRDEQLIKPLYYYEDENYLIIASEIKAIQASGLCRLTLCARQIQHYWRFRAPETGNTFFREIKALPAGMWQFPLQPQRQLTHHKKRLGEVNPLLFTYTHLSETQIVESAYGWLLEAVAMQSRVGSPAVWLSGGVDSSLLLALLHEGGEKAVPALTIVPGQEGKRPRTATKDVYYAQKVARYFQAEWHPVEVRRDEFLEQLPGFWQLADQPIADPATALVHLLAAQTAPISRCVLAGTGADEWWAGYERHRAWAYYLNHTAWWHRLARLAKPWVKRLPLMHDRVRQLKKWLFPLTGTPPEYLYYEWASLRLPAALPKYLPPLHTTADALQFDRNFYLPQVLLSAQDYYAGRHAVEVRVPYLMPFILRLLQRLPADMLLTKGKKWVLKTLLQRLAPGLAPVAKRRKEGFGVPLGDWMRQTADASLWAVFRNAQAPVYEHIDFEDVQALWKQHLHHHDDFTHELWAVLQMNAFLQAQ
ncbi:MAG: asparagine synthetase B [Thermonema sp.]|uniref:asparagine synthetase B family protein n=1 Tax=Thermonema sp. TaxID=2231181 RepID=UPI0021DD4515|nr:asparagine synthase-related protein [Thermonema sp.]GIV39624.1 MAG: asparagine synthetase B [Thermonema sp.]